MHRALRQAECWDWIVRNPAAKSTPSQLYSKSVQPPSAAQLRRLIAVIKAGKRPELAAYAWLVAATGARRGEFCGLRHRDFDPTKGTLRLVRSVTQVRQEITVKDIMTHQDRSVGIDPDAVAVLVGPSGGDGPTSG